MIDQAIAVLLILYPLVVFLGKGSTMFLYSFLILLISKIFTEKFHFRSLIRISILGIIIISLVIKNYLGILGEKDYFSGAFNLNSISLYAITMITIMVIMYIFSDIYSLKNIYNILEKYNSIILLEVIISQIIIAFKYVTGSGFTVINGLRNFNGTYSSSGPHPFAYAMIFMVIVIEWLYLVRKNSITLILYIIPIFTAILSGARTPTGALIIIFLSIRIFKNKNQKFSGSLGALIGICSIILLSLVFHSYFVKLISSSAFIQKFITAAKTSNVSSGRDIFWQICINTFNNDFDIGQKLLGRGIYYTMLINKKSYDMTIWAHSDFLDLMISYGLIFLMLYVVLYIKFFYNLFTNSKNKVMICGIFFGFLLLSAFNGIVNYPFFIGIFSYISILILSLNNTSRIENSI